MAFEELAWFFLDLVLEEVELEEVLVVVYHFILLCACLLLFMVSYLSVFQQDSKVKLSTVH